MMNPSRTNTSIADPPAEPPRPEIYINLSMQSMCGAARFAVLESLLGSLVFSLQQCPRQIHELRAWRTKFEEAELRQRETGGRKTPRGLTCRRALSFITRYDAMMEGAKLAFINRRVVQTVIVLGPSATAPRFVLHVNFEEGVIGDPPLQRIRPSIYGGAWGNRVDYDTENDEEEDDEGFVSSSAETETDGVSRLTKTKRERSTISHGSSSLSTLSQSGGGFELSSALTDTHHFDLDDVDKKGHSPPPPPLIRESYQQPLEAGAHGLISRAAARQLIVEAQTVYGMQPVSLNKIHLLIQTQRLVDNFTESSLSSSSSSSSSLVEEDTELTELVPLFHPKPSFSLRQPRKRIVRMVREELIEETKEDVTGDAMVRKVTRHRSSRLVRTPMWSAPKYRLVTAKVSGRLSETISAPEAGDSTSVSVSISSPIYKLEWYQWIQSPQSFKGALPNPPKQQQKD